MCGSMADIQFRPLRLGEGLGEEKKKEETRKIEITGQEYNGLPYYIRRP